MKAKLSTYNAKIKTFKTVLMVLIATLGSFQTSAQIRKVGDKVEMPVGTYQKIRTKFYSCDTLVQIKNDQLSLKDSIIAKQQIQIDTLKGHISHKDTTIKDLRIMLLQKPESIKWYNRKEPYIIGIVSFIIGLIISR